MKRIVPRSDGILSERIVPHHSFLIETFVGFFGSERPISQIERLAGRIVRSISREVTFFPATTVSRGDFLASIVSP